MAERNRRPHTAQCHLLPSLQGRRCNGRGRRASVATTCCCLPKWPIRPTRASSSFSKKQSLSLSPSATRIGERRGNSPPLSDPSIRRMDTPGTSQHEFHPFVFSDTTPRKPPASSWPLVSLCSGNQVWFSSSVGSKPGPEQMKHRLYTCGFRVGKRLKLPHRQNSDGWSFVLITNTIRERSQTGRIGEVIWDGAMRMPRRRAE